MPLNKETKPVEFFYLLGNIFLEQIANQIKNSNSVKNFKIALWEFRINSN